MPAPIKSGYRRIVAFIIISLCLNSSYATQATSFHERITNAGWRLEAHTDKRKYLPREHIKLVVTLTNVTAKDQDAMNGGVFLDYFVEIVRDGKPIIWKHNVLRRWAEGSSWSHNVEPGKSQENVSQIDRVADLTTPGQYAVSVGRDVKTTHRLVFGWRKVRKTHLTATAMFEVVRPSGRR